MNLICPECLGALVTEDGKTARCPTHGGQFEILFLRDVPAQSAIVPPTVVAAGFESAAAVPPATPPAIATMHCVQHPSVPATQQCTSCGAYMCNTCDFALEGGIHLCPACATKPRTGMSSKRKQAMIWSYVCGASATLAFFLVLMSAAARRAQTHLDQQAAGMLLLMFVFVPAAVGVGLGMGSIDRRLSNPVSLWIATLWNGLILAVFVLMGIIGAMR